MPITYWTNYIRSERKNVQVIPTAGRHVTNDNQLTGEKGGKKMQPVGLNLAFDWLLKQLVYSISLHGTLKMPVLFYQWSLSLFLSRSANKGYNFRENLTYNARTSLYTNSSMLYNGSDAIRDVEWVIFDEVHYINDDEVKIFSFNSVRQSR